MFTIRRLTLPLPFTIVWMMMVQRFALDSFLIGYVLSYFIMLLVLDTQELQRPAKLSNLPRRLWTFITYVIRLWWKIFISGVDVALRVLGFRTITRSGIVAVPIQDDLEDPVIAGLSAHGITITPGELVVAYDEEEKVMYVHCLDVEASLPFLNERQAERVKTFRRILGHD